MNPRYFEGQIAGFAASDPSTEQCGLVHRDGAGLIYATHERNVHPSPAEHFTVDTEAHLAAILAGTLVGYWHSHPIGAKLEPSEPDKAIADAVGLPCWVWINETQILHCYVPESRRGGLEGRRFLPMVHDCVSLVTDFYRTELGIELPFVPRIQEDYGRGFQGHIGGLIEAAGARIVQAPPIRNDIILMAMGTTRINHMGIYLGEGHMLHQVLNRESERVPYGGMWAKNTVAILRIVQAQPDSRPTRPIHEGRLTTNDR